MRLSEFDFRIASNVEALERALKSAKHLEAVHSAQVKAAFDMAEALDQLNLGRDEMTSRFTVGRLQNTYIELLRGLGLNYERETAVVTPSEDAEPVTLTQVVSLDELREAARG